MGKIIHRPSVIAAGVRPEVAGLGAARHGGPCLLFRHGAQVCPEPWHVLLKPRKGRPNKAWIKDYPEVVSAFLWVWLVLGSLNKVKG